MKTQFYILGLLLRYGPQHGYLLKQTVEEQIADFARIKLPNIYYHLEKLQQKGYVSVSFERDGNRPEKTVYSITEEGRNYFYVLLKKLQREELQLELPLDGAIFFSECADSRELAAAITAARQNTEQKLKNIMAHRENSMRAIPEPGKASAEAIFSHHIYHIKAELEWLKELEKGL